MVHVDLFFIPGSKKGKFKAVLIIVDAFSKWIECILLMGLKSIDIWRAFEKEFIYRFGPPVIVISDNGGEFLSHFDENLKRREIRHRFITSHNPQSNG